MPVRRRLRKAALEVSGRSARLTTWRMACLLVSIALLLPACHTLRLDQRGTDADWLTEGDSPGRQHKLEGVLDPPLKRRWVYNANAGFGPGSPLIVGPLVLVANRKGEVHAIRLETGKKAGMREFGDAIEGTPVVRDGVLFVPVGWGGRSIQAYDLRRARTRWKVRGAPVEAGLLLTGEHLFVADLEGYVRAYRTEDGEEVWEYPMGEKTGVHAAPVAVDNGRVVVADEKGRVVALNADDGRLLWEARLDAPVYVTPAAGLQTVFMTTTRGRAFALDADTGEIRWQYAAADTTVRLASPALDGDDLVFGGSDGVLRALDARTGAVQWTRALDGAITAAPLITEHTVYTGSMRNELYGVDRETGTLQWAQELEGRVKSAFAARGRYLVVLSEPRLVYLFEMEEEAEDVQAYLQ